MKHTHEPVVVLTDEMVSRTLDLIRADALLGDETSSWSSVCPTEWEATDRLRMLVEEGTVALTIVKPESIVAALREFEVGFFATV